MGCPPVRGDNPRALASGLSYVQYYKQIKNRGGRSNPFFLICLYFLGAGGDENLKKLA